MSSNFQDTNAQGHGELTRELRQWTSLSASIFRVVATNTGMAVTDIQVISLLDVIGPSSAGQLADFTGLTTGAITRILDRLEKGGLVRRERDRSDGRKIIVRLVGGKDDMQQVRSLLSALEKVWGEVAARYDEEQSAFLLSFLKQSNTLFRQELLKLQQEAPVEEKGIFSAPLEEQKRGRLAISRVNSRLNLRATDHSDRLYQARFEGSLPKVSTKDGAVIIRYPRRLPGLGEKPGAAEIALSTAIPWRIAIDGGPGEVNAHLPDLDLAKMEVVGGFSLLHLELGTPSGVVPISISAGTSLVEVQRPAGVAVLLHLTGWISELVFDEQAGGGMGPDVQLQSAGFDPNAPYYYIDITGYANKVTIT